MTQYPFVRSYEASVAQGRIDVANGPLVIFLVVFYFRKYNFWYNI